MATLGYWAIALTLLVSVYTAIASVLGTRRGNVALKESARNGALIAAGSASVASASLLYLLLSRDFSVQYVYEHVSLHLATLYTVSAFWAGQAGSLLLWMWLVCVLTAVMVLWKRVWGAPLGPYVLAVMSATQVFLALVLLLLSNPFAVLPTVPIEGQSLNPLLQNVWMIAHPPVVFVSYAAYTVPFALALAGLVVGQLGANWLRAVRFWALLAWLFLGAGILMGAWWAYLELGWGGYWGWDPVENSSLIPWLVGTALLHSLLMQRSRKASVTWNLWLISATFVLCILATFITRSGLIQSVHAFGRSPIGYYFLGFIALCLLALVALLYLRRRDLADQHGPGMLLSREAGLFLTNLLLLGTALVVLVGTLFPALTELFQGRQGALDSSFYERAVGPLAQLIIAVLGICPWLAWGGISWTRLRRDLLVPAIVALVAAGILFLARIREFSVLLSLAICAFVIASLLAFFYRGAAERRHATGEGWPQALYQAVTRNRRRYGAHIVHLGIVLIAVGITGSSVYQEEVQIALAPGEQRDVLGYTLAYQDFRPENTPAYQRFMAVVQVLRGNRPVATLRPTKDFYGNIEQWVTEVAIHTTLKEDLYLILAGFEPDGLASFRVLINPLVVWLWIGGVVLLLGGTIAWWPTAMERSSQ